MRKVLILLLLLGACAKKPAESTPAPEGPPPLAVRVLLAEGGVLEKEGQAPARLEPKRQSRVAAPISGRVASTLEAGSRVRAGEVVVQLDPKPFQEALEGARLALAQAQANLERAERQREESLPTLRTQLASAQANLETARRRYEEAKALYEVGAVARLDLLALEAQLRQAEAAYQNAKEALHRAERGEELKPLRLQVEQARLQVQQAERQLRETGIRAPFEGEVVEVHLRPGEFAAAGQGAFLLGSLNLVAKAYLSPLEAENLAQARLFLKQEGREAEARLLRKTSLPGQNRQMEVVLEPLSPLAPGSATLAYRIAVAQGILLPTGAVRLEGGEAYVFVVEEGRARKRTVRILATQGERMAVEGVRPGEKVVYPVPESLRDGDRVAVTD